MIDFENGSVFKLRRVKGFPSEKFIGPLLVPANNLSASIRLSVITLFSRIKESFQ